jgi:dTDP-4-dehydrorhamnose reductase
MRILVTGASGFVGFWVAKRLLAAGHEVVGTHCAQPDRLAALNGVEPAQLELADPVSVRSVFESAGPEVVVHCAAMPDLGPCQQAPELARRCNTQATIELARLTADRRGRFVFLSTDQVFDGEASLYAEEDEPNPLHVYGQTKLDAEQAVLELQSDAWVIRTALVYGQSPSGKRSASEQVVNKLRAGEVLRLFTDEYRTPIYIEDAAAAIECCALTPSRAVGSKATPGDRMLHIAGPDRVSRYEFGVAVARAAGLDHGVIHAAKQADVALPLPRPKDLSMRIERLRVALGQTPRSLAEGLAQTFC